MLSYQSNVNWFLTFCLEHKTRIFTAIIEMLQWFAGKQIRSVGVSMLQPAL